MMQYLGSQPNVQKSQSAWVKVPSTPQHEPVKVHIAEEKVPSLEQKLPVRQLMLRTTPSSRRSGLRQKRVRGSTSPSLPPANETSITVRHKFRFSPSGSTAEPVTIGNVLGAIGGICTVVNSSIVSLASSFKIHKVSCWPSTSTSETQFEVVWSATAAGGYMKDSSPGQDMPAGMTVTKPARAVPPPNSLAREWLSTGISGGGGDTIFTIQAQSGSVVELDVSFTIKNNLGGITNTVTTAVLGAFYYLALDGPTSNVFVPLRVPTTH